MEPRVASIDPATGEIWREWLSASPDDVADAVARARAAQPAWAARSLGSRRAVLRRFRRLLFEHRGEVASLIERESGKPAAEALMADVITTLDAARFLERRSLRLLAARTIVPSNIAVWRKRVTITLEPYGVIGIISPWNYPLLLPASSSLAALVAGNAVVLKPSELTSATAVRLGELLRGAGVPEPIMQVLPGDGATGAALANAPVDKLLHRKRRDGAEGRRSMRDTTHPVCARARRQRPGDRARRRRPRYGGERHPLGTLHECRADVRRAETRDRARPGARCVRLAPGGGG